MEKTREVTTFQAATILISTMIGVGVLPLPLFAVRSGDTGAPFITVLGIGIGAIALIIITKLGLRHPNKTIISYSEDIIGKWLGKIFSLLVILFFLVLTALAAREFGAVVITAVLLETPLEVTVLVMLLLAAISARNTMNTFVYIHSFYIPIILAPVLIIVALSLKNANFLYLRPFIASDLKDSFNGALTVAALLQGSFLMTLIIPTMKNPKSAVKASLWAIFISGGLYVLIVAATVSIFGTEEIKKLYWPTLELARTTSLPGNILQRLDVVFISVWVIAVFTTIFASYFLTIQSLKEYFNLQDHKMLAYFLLPFIFTLAMVPQNILQLYDIILFIGKVGLIFTFFYPMVLYCWDLIRNKRGSKDESKQA
ncbi:GerAB/ArcD/ProY family transporter [Bacillus dakarensis]|uniref:GerAB/ArcD/ProY family transporter n=1 Tax=Robertmurraya dakarensis TaxID=1926278 RepID=UPI000981F37B|nr:endospore germination permease [Bacillus dakarensis]